MKGCHSCEHAEAIAEGRLTRYEDSACSKCGVASEVGLVLQYEDDRMPSTHTTADPLNQVVGLESDGTSIDPEICRLPVAALTEFIRNFLTLKPGLRDVVALRYQGQNYNEIGRAFGISRAAAEKRHRQAMKEFPALQELFPEKAGNGRKPKQEHRTANPQNK